MSDPLALLPGETAKANQALKDYLALGPGRSLKQLHGLYQETVRSRGKAGVPTRHLSTLEGWSVKHSWQVRAQRWDSDQAQKELTFCSDRMAEERRKWRERRLKLLEAQFSNVARMMKHLNGDRSRDAIECTANELDRAIRTLLAESRLELSDKPTPGHELVGPDGNPVVSVGSLKKAVREMSDIALRHAGAEIFERIQKEWFGVKFE